MNTMIPLLTKLHQQEVSRYQNGEIPAILKALKETAVKRDDLKKIIFIRYQVAHFFEDMLRYMIVVIRNDTTLIRDQQEALVSAASQNLKEELGEFVEYGGPHREGREVLLSALGIDYQDWSKNLGTYNSPGNVSHAVKDLILSIKEIISRGAIEAITALWYYENRISLDGVLGDYYILLHAFETQFPEFKKPAYTEGDALWHIASHANHDEYHAGLAEDALHKVMSLCGSQQKILTTFEDMKKACDDFWNEIEKEL